MKMMDDEAVRLVKAAEFGALALNERCEFEGCGPESVIAYIEGWVIVKDPNSMFNYYFLSEFGDEYVVRIEDDSVIEWLV